MVSWRFVTELGVCLLAGSHQAPPVGAGSGQGGKHSFPLQNQGTVY